MSVEEFDSLKTESDESYEGMAASDYLEERNCTSVISFDEASIADTEESVEERLIREIEEMEHPFYETWENALAILENCGLTAAQKRRYWLHYYKGMTVREIAIWEGIGQHRAIIKSLRQCERKIENYKKIFLKCPKMGTQNP